MNAVKFLIVLGISLLLAHSSPAQQLFPGYLEPAFRGDSGTEYTEWDLFFNPYLDPNYGDIAAAVSSPTLTQTLASSAFITGAFNIYSFAEATGYELSNDTSSTIGTVNSLVFQFDTLGTFIDPGSILLNYDTGSGTVSIPATSIINEYRIITGGFGGFTNRAALQWDLTGLGITSYSITFEALGSSNSFSGAVLDVSSGSYTEVVPSARSWDSGGSDNQWSTASNWSGDINTTPGGNVLFGSSSPIEVNLDSNREIGLLEITKPGSFEISSPSNSTLTINSGITADQGSGSSKLSTNIHLGGHSLIHVESGSNLEISGSISGAGVSGSYPAAGIYKTGDGALSLSGDNSFSGSLTIDGGSLQVSGNNSYSGATAVVSGNLVIQADAPSGTNGALGSATSNVSLGVDPATYGLLDRASILIEGNHVMARNITLAGGSQEKEIGSLNGAAQYSGNISLNSSANNVFFTTSTASDSTRFSGAISGGGTSQTLNIQGPGTVLYSGSNKTYSNATNIASGTLVIESGTSTTGNGAWSVASGATLRVDGTLGGTGLITLNGGRIGGSGTINKTLNIDTGDILAPGNSPGTLTIGSDMSWGENGHLEWEINDTDAGAGNGWDYLYLTGTLSLTSTNLNPFTVDILSLTLSDESGQVHDFSAANSYSWLLLSADGGISGFDPQNIQLDTSGFSNSYHGTWSLSQSGNELYLNYAAIPEPSTHLMLLAGIALLWYLQKCAQKDPSQL